MGCKFSANAIVFLQPKSVDRCNEQVFHFEGNEVQLVFRTAESPSNEGSMYGEKTIYQTDN